MNNQEELIRREILGIKEYIPGKPIEETQRELGLTDVIKLASNENPLGPAKKCWRPSRRRRPLFIFILTVTGII